ncbi:MAG TPA: NUDIX domain-containing protein [Magnetospirillaceae bacterium]|nr:NUDIX domain-containing protein [Magnetospirillaceae bacterium]
MKETIFAKGKLFELVHLPQKDGRIFEVARRAPGVRLIIADRSAQKILLTREFRHELHATDYRLPGGKVFDTLKEYESHRNSGDEILVAAAKKAKAEAVEEAGMDITEVVLFKKSTLGATVEWDLFVFEAKAWQPHPAGQSLEDGEQVESVEWFSFTKAEQMILHGDMQEERIALILLQWLKGQV